MVDSAIYVLDSWRRQSFTQKEKSHWNYDTRKEAPYTEQGQPQIDENGQQSHGRCSWNKSFLCS